MEHQITLIHGECNLVLELLVAEVTRRSMNVTIKYRQTCLTGRINFYSFKINYASQLSDEFRHVLRLSHFRFLCKQLLERTIAIGDSMSVKLDQSGH